MGQFTRVHHKFEYHMEDFYCAFCLHYDIENKRGCTLRKCCCEEEKRAAIENNRLKRPKGWFRWDS
jgi:hypothetical protein